MEEKQFSEFIKVNDRFGKILICGLEGFGKTLLLSYMAVEKMLIGEQECWKSWEKVDKYNALGYNFSKNYEHLVFVAFMTINCSATHIPDRTSYACDPYRIGLYMEDWDTDLYPPGATIFIPEIQRVYNSYNSERIRPRIYGYWETSRQYGVSLVGDCQRYMMVAKPLRDLINRFIVLTKEITHVKDIKGNVIGHKLYVLEFNSNKDIELWGSTGRKDNAKEYVLYLPRLTFGNYDSYYFEYSHLKGRYNQDFYIDKYPDITSIDDVEYIDDTEVPEGFLLSKKTTKKEVVEEASQQDNYYEF